MKIRVEQAKRMTPAQERDVMRAAYLHNPASARLRRSYALLLNMTDRFDETIDLLGSLDLEDRYAEYMLLAQAHLARETVADTERACAVSDLAMACAVDDDARAAAAADKGKALRRLGEVDGAREALEQALRLNPANKDACKRLAALHLDAGNPEAVLDFTERLGQQGAGHSRLFAARVLAQVRLGEIDAARALIGLDTMLFQRDLPPPPGWSDTDAFNAALAEELLAHPGLYFDRYGSASEKTWRIDAPVTGAAPLTRALLNHIAAMVTAHVKQVGDLQHPWVATRPSEGILHSWSVITESAGFETWHVHQFGWMSGVYYVQVPDDVVSGDTPGGCIAFGLPEDIAGQEASDAFGTQLVRPRSGTLLLFPSHTYHRTFPHGKAERRICVAFDIWPA